VSDLIRFRLDDLRRYATELASGVGLTPPRAAALAAHLLWFDAVGASTFGIVTLPRWLGRIHAREFDDPADGKMMNERNGTALLDGRNGVPPLVLERAAVLASEKARELGIGLVRVSPLGPTGPAAGLAAELAIGPYLAAIVGPGPAWSLAFPSACGLPVVFDSHLALDGASPPRRRPEAPPWWTILAGWVEALAPAGGWLVTAISISAWEPLPSFHERMAEALGDPSRSQPGLLRPDALVARRHEVHKRGVALPEGLASDLTQWAERLGVTPPGPLDIEPR
jgi:LDH2 family malate/lactate/ureidoglycolate dehydrogenase